MVWERNVAIDQSADGTSNKVFVGNFPVAQDTELVGGSVDMRGQARVAEKTLQIHYNGKFPLSSIRLAATVANGGSVTKVNSEIVVQTTVATNSSAIHQTRQRGDYMCGLTGCADISGRCPVTPTGGGSVIWGYIDANDGYGFGRDATGVFVFFRKAGFTTKTYQSAWNGDKLDGTGASGLVLNVANGNIYNIEYNWFGYGTTEYAVFLPTPSGRAERIIVHIDKPAQDSQRINNPNLPLRIEVNNGGAATALSFAWGGLAFSVLGKIEGLHRYQYDFVTGKAFGNNTNQIYLMSIRHKNSGDFEAIRCHLDSIKAIASSVVVLEVRIDVALTGATFNPPVNQPATESACEVDSVASAFSGGTVVFGQVLASGNTADNEIDLESIDIPAGSTLTFLARQQVAAGGQSMSVYPRWKEEW